jgi:Leucine-rich repeat (LRR) protein
VVVDERAVLERLFAETGGQQWLQFAGWLSDANDPQHYCTWWGVFCNEDKQVVSIQLSNNGLTNNVPSQLYTLPALQMVDLHGNPLLEAGLEGLLSSSSSPLAVVDLSETLIRNVTGIGAAASTLQVLKVSRMNAGHNNNNYYDDNNSAVAVVGSAFPGIELSQLTQLHTLHLHSCGWTGTLPSEMGELTSLQEVYLYSNELSGTIPETIFSSWTSVRVLSLSDNRWSGSLPTSLGEMKNLELLSLKGRATGHSSSTSSSTKVGRWTGPLPTLADAVHLQHVFLDHNAFTGTIPATFLQNTDVTKVVTVHLESNLLTGTVPGALSRFATLNLQLTQNALVGPLPEAFCTKSAWMVGTVGMFGCDAILCNAGTYSATGQQVSRDKPCQPCPTTMSLLNSGDLTVQATAIGSTQCESAITNTDPAAQQEQQVRILAEFYLALSGPVEWGTRWSDLDDLLLALLGDSSSSDIEDVRNVLADVDFSGVSACNWNGILCNEHGFVEIITLPNNHMVGTIPETLFQLPNLQSLDLSYNLVQVDDFTVLQYASSLTRLRLSHTAVKSMVGISFAVHLHELLLDGCDFNGASIPSELYQLSNLHTLHLEASFLAGRLAPDIRQLSKLRRYD